MSSIRTAFTAAASGGLLALSSVLAFAQQNAGTDHIETLQRRLIDAGCYHGPIDGKDSADLQSAIKACPSQEPMLLIETGMQVAPVKRIGVDRACRVAVTGSYDKTVRVWSMPEGRLLHTLRGAIGPGDGGKIYAVAVSPDGRWIVSGGWDAQWDVAQQDFVHVFGASTGSMVASRVIRERISHLAFSPDGRCWRRPAARTSASRFSRRKAGGPPWRIRTMPTTAMALAFAPDGHSARRYDGSSGDMARATFQKGTGGCNQRRQESIIGCVNPRGLVAVGFRDSGVDVYKASTLKFLFSADVKGLDNGNLSKVAWSSDGKRLIVGGSYEALFQKQWKSPLVTFDAKASGSAKPCR